MITPRDWFSSLKMIEPNTWGVDLVNNQKFWAHGVGTIHVNHLVNWNWHKHVLEGVLYVPFLKKNNFSIGQAIDKRLVITYRKNTCFFINAKGEGKVVMTWFKPCKLYNLHIKVVPSKLVPNTKWPKLSNFFLFGNSRINNSL